MVKCLITSGSGRWRNKKNEGTGTVKTRQEFKANLLRHFSEEEAERMTAEEYDR